ncbi:hypothetical protein MMC25_000755 [Agyrium rufum]|nr:hypothetical protein [Agyrium rufum]
MAHGAEKPETRTDRERFPELFRPDPCIDRHTCTRQVPMKVLVLGLMRTGTASMSRALEMLGYNPTYHYFTQFENPSDCDMWKEAFDAKYFGGKPFTKENWDQLLGHVQAVTDVPAACFGPELIAAYPDAKVILTNRDVDKWHHSIMTTVFQAHHHPLLPVLFFIDKKFMGRWRDITIGLIRGFFQGSPEKNGKRIYQEHYDEIRRIVPKENLLEFQIGEGWERMCEFLGDEVPKEPFPNVNETRTFGDRLDCLRKQRLWAGLKPYVYGLSAAAVAGTLWATGAWPKVTFGSTGLTI